MTKKTVSPNSVEMSNGDDSENEINVVDQNRQDELDEIRWEGEGGAVSHDDSQ